MTNGQRWIRLYISQRFQLDKVKLRNIGDGTVQVTDQTGATMNFTCNIFGDIMDADTKEIVADSNVTHNLDELARHMEQEPTAWTDNYKYFNK